MYVLHSFGVWFVIFSTRFECVLADETFDQKAAEQRETNEKVAQEKLLSTARDGVTKYTRNEWRTWKKLHQNYTRSECSFQWVSALQKITDDLQLNFSALNVDLATRQQFQMGALLKIKEQLTKVVSGSCPIRL